MDKTDSTSIPDVSAPSTPSNKRGPSPVYQWAKLVRAVNRQGGVPTNEQIAEARRTLAAFAVWSEHMRSQ